VLTEEKYNMLENRLRKVQKHLGKRARRQSVSCYRIYDHDLPEFPFCIEWYADKLYVAEYQRRHGMAEEQHQFWLSESMKMIAKALDISVEAIFLKTRQRKENRESQYRKLDEQGHEFPVEENGLQFLINLTDYLDTGLFLDHRDTRQRVRLESAEKKMLNLFAYTGSFSVYAAAGNAAEVLTVDLSNTYLNWARRNMRLNGFTDETKYRYEQRDVKAYLPELENASFDIIVMDPPTFSNSKRMDDILDIQRDYVQLINECLRILKAEGKLYFSTNLRSFKMDASLIKGTITDITKQTTPFDFERGWVRPCFEIRKIS